VPAASLASYAQILFDAAVRVVKRAVEEAVPEVSR